MEWRIVDRKCAGWVAEKGIKIEKYKNPDDPQETKYELPVFDVYERHAFETEEQAIDYVKKHPCY